MREIIRITDFGDPRIDPYVRLTGAQLRNRLEAEKGIFIAESPTVIGIALEAGYTPVSLLTEDRLLGGEVEKIIAKLPEDTPVYTASRELLRTMTGFELTRGALAAFYRPKMPTVRELIAGGSRIAVLEEIADSTNIGAVFRSAAALGVDAVLITPTCCDPLCRRALRVSMGTVLQVPWTRVGSCPDDWPREMDTLHEMGYKTVAMALSRDTVRIDDPRLRAEKRLAIILGTEGTGLKSETICRASYTAKIPMAHGVDSLNVAAAGAVAFFALCSRVD
ncbi:MAG: RNA methyltransferase [Clostridia bacterium]|nr:RNA methyltransferase [Clostridia bacterium]